jgi:hypothetical protein
VALHRARLRLEVELEEVPAARGLVEVPVVRGLEEVPGPEPRTGGIVSTIYSTNLLWEIQIPTVMDDLGVRCEGVSHAQASTPGV